ncbi:MAG: B12-binding domain-containing radical SAM protein [Candidatus Heimdallarchaeota archaeon]
MKILLSTPPTQQGAGYKNDPFLQFYAPPLGLAYIAAVLEEAGYRPKILDAQSLGLSLKEFVDRVQRLRPDILGVQTFTPSFGETLDVAVQSKAIGIPWVVLGGAHPTLAPDETLTLGRGHIDLVIRGEAEYTFLELVRRLELGKSLTDLRGISYQENGQIMHNPDARLIDNLDSLPFPARHLLPMDVYRIFSTRLAATTAISSRGCPYNCSFCTVSHFYGRHWRMRSATNIADELELLSDYGTIAIAFVDDLFGLNPRRVRELCREIRRRRLDEALIWGATVRADIKSSLLKSMADAHCKMVFVGVESAKQKTLDNVKKGITLTKVKDFFKHVKRNHIGTIGSFALGFPGETKQDILATIEWAITLNPNLAVFTLATPYPGTAFWEECIKKGWVKEEEYHMYNLFNPVIETIQLTLEDLKVLLRYAYKRFYLRFKKLAEEYLRELSLSWNYGFKTYLRNAKIAFNGLKYFQRL